MERIRVFKGRTGLAKFFVIFGIIYTLSGLALFTKYLTMGFNFSFPSGDWNSVFFVFQGILFIIMGYAFLNRRKYFIEWDDKEMRFLLPGAKAVDSVIIDDIKSVNIRLFEIEMELKNGTRKINLENLEFEDIRKIKGKLEKLQKGI
jgi:hypothetical protein